MKKLTIAAILYMAWVGEAGNGNVVVGNGNVVKGNGNIADGNRDRIDGNNNVQIGDQSSIIGSNNFHEGDNKQILGDNHYVSSQHPQYESYKQANQGIDGSSANQNNFNIWGSPLPVQRNSQNTNSQLTSEQQNEHAEQTHNYKVASESHPNSVSDNTNGMSDITRDFLQGRRQEILNSFQNRLRNRISLNSGILLP